MITKKELIAVVLEILNKEQMEQLVSRLKQIDQQIRQEELEQETCEDPIVLSKKVVNDDFTVNREEGQERRSVPVRASENTWSDSGEENKGEEKQIVKPPTRRLRKKVEMVKINCSVCHQPKEIAPGLMTSSRAYYRCENCVGGR